MAEEATSLPPGSMPFNPMSPEFQADPYPHYHRLRDLAPVHCGPQSVWMVTGYRPAVEVLDDRRWALIDDYSCLAVGAAYPGDAAPALKGPRAFLAPLRREAADGTDASDREARMAWEHLARQELVRRPRRMEPRIRSLAERLLDRALEVGRVDLMEAVALPMPLLVTCDLLGVPAAEPTLSIERIRPLMRGMDPVFTLTPGEIERRDAASRALGDYFAKLVAGLRRRPRDDLLSVLAVGSTPGDALLEQELGATCALLFVAAFTTTAHFIGNAVLALLQHPEELRRFRADPDLAASAVEELLRFDPPAQFTVRVAQDDLELNGHAVRSGEIAIIFTASANRDPTVFSHPDHLVLTRPNSRRHLTFSHGPHACLGAPLARMQGGLLLATMMRRLQSLELDGEPVREPGFVARALSSLPVSLR